MERASGETYGGENALRSLLERTTFVSELMRGRPPKLLTLDALPTADETQQFALLLLPGGAGVADVLYLGIKNDADAYEWIDISTAPTPYTPTQGSSTSDLKDDMVTNGLVANGGATPLNLDGGTLTVGDLFTTSGGTRVLGLFGAGGATKQTVTGSRGGNAALNSLLTALAAYGLITNSTSA